MTSVVRQRGLNAGNEDAARLCDERSDIRTSTHRNHDHADHDRCRSDSLPRTFTPEQAKRDAGSGERKGQTEKEERHCRDGEEAQRNGLGCRAIGVVVPALLA